MKKAKIRMWDTMVHLFHTSWPCTIEIYLPAEKIAASTSPLIACTINHTRSSPSWLLVTEVAQTMGIKRNEDQIPCFKFRYQMMPHDIVCDIAIRGESPRHQYPGHIQYHIPR